MQPHGDELIEKVMEQGLFYQRERERDSDMEFLLHGTRTWWTLTLQNVVYRRHNVHDSVFG